MALRATYIDTKLYNELYWAAYKRKPNKKRKKSQGGYKINLQYYTELYYSTVDYFGECDEHSLISMIRDMLFCGP